jgi:hypothetical protein
VIATIAWTRNGTPRLGIPHRIVIGAEELVFLDAAGTPIPGWRERLEAVAGYRFRPTHDGWSIGDWVQALVLPSGKDGAVRVVAVACDPGVPGRCGVHVLTADGREELGAFDLPRLPSGVSRTARLHEVDGETFVPDWKLASLSAADLDGDGVRDEILLGIRSNRLFPTETVALDFDGSWHVLADYWNMGTTKVMTLPDLDGDGKEEIAVYGENNSMQRGVVTLLASKQGFPVGARSPDGYRLARLGEVEGYPYAGLTIQFPFADLAAAEDRMGLRNPVLDLALDEASGSVHVRVQDVAMNPASRERWNLSFRLDTGAAPPSAFVQEYDAALTILKKRIASGELRDRWKIVATERLTDYGLDLASRIQVWNPLDPAPAWRPIRAGELATVFPKTTAIAEAR